MARSFCVLIFFSTSKASKIYPERDQTKLKLLTPVLANAQLGQAHVPYLQAGRGLPWLTSSSLPSVLVRSR